MYREELLDNLKRAAVSLALIAIVDTVATGTSRENNINALLGYTRVAAALIVASSV